MKIIDRIKSYIGGQAIKLTNSNHKTFLGTDNSFDFGNDNNYLTTAYGVNPAVFMVVDKIATVGARLERTLTDVNNPEKDVRSPDLEELLANPNEKETLEQLYYRLIASYEVTGDAFLVGIDANFDKENPMFKGTVHSLSVPIVTNVTINEDTYGNVLGYTITEFGVSRNYETEQVLHIKKPNITEDSNNGFSSLGPSKVVWVTDSLNWKNEASMLKNSGIRGVLYVDGGRVMPEKERETLQNKYDTTYGNSNVFGKVRIDTQKLGFLNMAMKPKDMMDDEKRWSYLRYICGVYGIDSKIFNDPKSNTHNNLAEAKLSMYNDVIIPLVRMFDEAITEWLINGHYNEPNIKIAIDKGKITILNAPNKILSDKVSQEVNQGILTAEEAKEILYPDGVK